MKKVGQFFFISIILLCLFSCKKNNSSSQPKITSTWTFKGVVDTGMALSVQDNINFKYAINGQAKSISLNFYSAIKQSRIFYVSDTLTDSTKCTLKIDNGNGQIYSYVGNPADKINATLANYTIKFDFTNITVSSGTDTQSVSGNLAFPSLYWFFDFRNCPNTWRKIINNLSPGIARLRRSRKPWISIQ